MSANPTLTNPMGQPSEARYLSDVFGMLAKSIRMQNYRVVLALLELMATVSRRIARVN